VRPDCHPQLSQFCKLLTGIQQAEVDHGVSLKKALEMHYLWLEESGVKNTRFVIVTWSDWDCKVMLEMECKWKSLQKPPYFNRKQVVKEPGPTQGGSFFSCGKWTMTTDGKCLFFLWAPS